MGLLTNVLTGAGIALGYATAAALSPFTFGASFLLAAAAGGAVGFSLGWGIENWNEWIQIPEVKNTASSPNYGFGSGRSVSALDRPVPIIAGRVRVMGAIIYEGGEAIETSESGSVSVVEPAEVRNLMIAWGEGPVTGIFNLSSDNIKMYELDGALAANYYGTSTQNHDSRFVVTTNYIPFTSQVTVWDYDVNNHPSDAAYSAQAVVPKSFTPNQDRAVGFVHVRAQMHVIARDYDDNPQAVVRVEYNKNGGGWATGGDFLLSMPRRETGVIDYYIPISIPSDTAETATIGVDIPRRLYSRGYSKVVAGETYYELPQPGIADVSDLRTVQDQRMIEFDAQSQQVRVTLLSANNHTSLGSNVGSWSATGGVGKIYFLGIDLYERYGAQAFRHTAYSALTLPREAVSANQPKISAIVAGPKIPVWTGSAFETKWSNNPIWWVRNLLTDTRYGLGLTGGTNTYDGPDSSTWGGFKMAAADCDETIGTMITLTGGGSGAPALLGYHVEGNDGTKIAAGDTLYLWRGRSKQSASGNVNWITNDAVGFVSISSEPTHAEGDVWSLNAIAGDYDAFTEKAQFRVTNANKLWSYDYSGVSLNTSDYPDVSSSTDVGGYIARDGSSNEQLVVHHDWAMKVLMVEDEFAGSTSSIIIREQRFRFDRIFDTQTSADEMIREILSHCRGIWWEDEGQFRVAIEQEKTASNTIDYATMVEDSFKHSVEGVEQLPDTLVCEYIDPDQSWEQKDIIIGTNRQGGIVSTKSWLGSVSRHQTMRLGFYAKAVAVATGRASFATTLAEIKYEPGDVLYVKNPAGGSIFGYDISDPNVPSSSGAGEEVIIIAISDNLETDTREYLVREYAAAAYSDDPNIELPTSYRDNREFGAPLAATQLNLSFIGDERSDGIWDPWVRLSWIQPNPGTVTRWDVYESRDNGESYSYVATSQYSNFTWSVAGFNGLLYAKVVPINAAGYYGSAIDAAAASVLVTAQPMLHVGGMPVNGQLWTYNAHLTGSLGTGPASNPIATIRPGGGKYGNGVAVEEAATNLVDTGLGSWVGTAAPTVIWGSDRVLWRTAAAIWGEQAAIAGPSGFLDAYTVTDNDGSATERIYDDMTVTADSSAFTASIYVRKGVFNQVGCLVIEFGSAIYSVTLDVYGGSIGSSPLYPPDNSGVDDCGDWWRIWLTGDNDGSATCRMSYYPVWRIDGDVDALATTSATGSGVVWGPMLTNSEIPTSYSGISGVRTYPFLRYDDVASPREGTIAVWWNPNQPASTITSDPTSPVIFSLGTAAGNSSMVLWAYFNAGNDPDLRLYVRDQADGSWTINQIVSAYTTGWYTPGTYMHLAVTWTLGTTFRVYRNGVLAGTSYDVTNAVTEWEDGGNVYLGRLSSSTTNSIGNGVYDNLVLLTEAVSAETVNSWYNLGKPLFDPTARMVIGETGTVGGGDIT
jgi:hypothetical protein